jgi:hypothetical protein
MFYRWWRLDEVDRRRVWLLYGWYSGLMVCGSCFGVVTWVVRIMHFMNGFRANDALQNRRNAEGFSFFALALSWRAAFVVSYAIEFLLLSAARLMVLDRMSDFAAPQGDGMRKWWDVGVRIVMVVVVLGNAVGLAANVAAAVHFQSASEDATAASNFAAARNINDFRTNQASVREQNRLALSIAAVQMFCEVAVLLLIVAAFVVVGVLCARRVSFNLFRVDAASAAAGVGRALRRQIVGTTYFIFFVFVLRAVVSILLALAFQFSDSDNSRCPIGTFASFCDASCFNVFTHIGFWSELTPEFQTIVVLISSPLALLVALWGMTSELTLQLMRASQRETVPLRALQYPGSALS